MTIALCACGCGLPTPLASKTDTRRGWAKGKPLKWRHGHGGGRQSAPLMDRFWNRVLIGDLDECWPWTGPRVGPMGYGRAAVRKKTETAHRVAYRLANGEIPPGMVVRHMCDNPPCCNPHHLLIGTARDNAMDRVERDRVPRGEEVGVSRLTEAAVRDIRAIRASSDVRVADLARRYGVSRGAIRGVLEGKTWAHV